MQRSKAKKITVWVSGIVGILVLAMLIIQEAKINGFEKALANLVKTRTQGEYELIIGNADFDLYSLTYELRDVEIIRTGASIHPGGVQSIRIPLIEAKLGSLVSFFSSPRITFTDVVFSQPEVIVDSRVRAQNKVTIGEALVTVFPAVESVLTHFSIRSLAIVRARLTVQRPEEHPVKLQSINLLVENWHAEDSNEDGEIRLNIGPQQIQLSQASFSFGEMEYKYSEHYLIFKDFKFNSYDSATSSQIDVDGRSVLIRNLDYKELYANQRYKLDKIEITEPRFSGALRARTGLNRDREIHLPLAEILKQTFGEIQLDTATIENAVFQMTLAVDQDSIKANVPQVNIDLHDVAVVTDSTDIQFGELAMDLSETEISVNDNVRLICNSMLFERDEDLTISKIRLTDVVSNETFAACERIGFKNFRLFEFLIGRQLQADSIALKNADVTLTPAFLDLFPDFSGRSSGRRTTSVSINELSLQGVNLSYSNNILHLELNDVSTKANNIQNLSWSYLLGRLQNLELGAVSYENKNLDLRGRLAGIRLTPTLASMRRGEFSYGSLTAHATGLTAARHVPYSPGDDATQWKAINVGSLIMKGSLPKKQNPLVIGNLVIRDLDANLGLNGKTLSLRAKDLRVRDLNTAGYASFGELSSRVYEVDLSSHAGKLTIDSIMLDTDERSEFYNIRVDTNGNIAELPYARAEDLIWSDNEKFLRRFLARDLRYHEGDAPSLSADSLRLDGIQLTRNFEPIVDTVTMYEPEISFLPGRTENRFPNGQFLDGISLFTLHGGRIDIGNQRLTLIGTTHGRLGPDFNLTSDEMIFDAFQHHVTLNGVKITNGDVVVGGLSMVPTPDPENVYETDIIEARSQDLRIGGLMFDTLTTKQKIIADTLFLGKFLLDVKRDRRLPDPQRTEKPFSFEELLTAGALDANAVHLRDGIIRYTETSERSGEEGTIAFHDVNADISKDGTDRGYSIVASARLYDQAPVHVGYQYIDSSSFQIDASIGALDLTTLNQLLTPLQGMELKSGFMEEFQFEAIATRDSASGQAMMTYRDLRMAFLKKSSDPDKKNLGNEIITFLANGILRQKRFRATSPILETRVREKSMFNYWKRIAAHGALQVIKKGKKPKK